MTVSKIVPVIHQKMCDFYVMKDFIFSTDLPIFSKETGNIEQYLKK